MKKTLAVIGAGVVVGAIAYAVWHKMNKANQIAENNFESKNDNNNSETFAPTIVNKVNAEKDVITVKSTLAKNMAVRHEEAGQIMQDAVDIICKRSEVSDDETKELEQISSELDNLLSED